ncbi:MAG: GNAT family N-acetyltransferase [Salinibacterium sp.]|nr:GNAT family N-acetyltransferase [Salinibacterium sp.]
MALPASRIESSGGIQIVIDSPSRSDVLVLLEQHLAEMRATSPPESVHALDPTALGASNITFFTAREDGILLGCGALSALGGSEGEVKSMRTTPLARGRGVATLLLGRILDEARTRGYRAVSLETGVEEYFCAARSLYARFKFTECAPFASYTDDPNSLYFRIELG